MAAENEEIAVEVLYVDGEMRGTLRTVDHHRHTVFMGYVDELLHGIDRAEHVAHLRHAHHFRVLVEESLVGFNIKHASIRHRNDAQTDAALTGLQLPGHDVAMMLHDGDNDLVAHLHKFIAEGTGHKVESLGGATGEDYLAGSAGVDEAAHSLAGLLMQFCGLHAEVMDTTVHIGIGVDILVAHGVEHTQRLLRSGGIVKIDERLAVDLTAQDREIGPDVLNIVSCFHCLRFWGIVSRHNRHPPSDVTSGNPDSGPVRRGSASRPTDAGGHAKVRA